MSSIRRGFIGYAMLPGIIPRMRSFLGSGFSFIAGLLAVIYSSLGLLPATHPFLKPENFGRFGLIQVISEAGQNLTFSKKHIDQIIIYFTILMGMALLCVQFVLLVMALFTTPAFATTLWTDMFVNTPTGHNSSQDLAFIVLDNVFGVMQQSGTGSSIGFFNSCISDLGTDCLDGQNNIIYSPTVFPLPMHLALHQLLYFYSSGIAFLSLIIIIYFVIAIIGETVTSGTPFGQRFSKAWFIPRLIVFFALIAPVATSNNNAGINVAQMITFSIAKYGSNMATNAWLDFVDYDGSASPGVKTVVSSFLGQDQSMIARPNIPEIGGLTQFMYLVRMCMVAEKIMHGNDIRPYFVRLHSDDTSSSNELHDGSTSNPANMGGTTNDYLDPVASFVSFERAVIFSRYATVIMRFGHRDSLLYPEEWGGVQPTCGEVQFEISSLDPFVIGGSPALTGFQAEYYITLLEYFDSGLSVVAEASIYCMLEAILPINHQIDCVNSAYSASGTSQFAFNSSTSWLSAVAARSSVEFFNQRNANFVSGEDRNWDDSYLYDPGLDIINDVRLAVDDPAYQSSFLMPANLRSRGWAGAALWYNKASEVNGTIATAVQNLPKPYKYPMVMEQVAQQHQENDTNASFTHRFNPRLENGKMVKLPRPGDQYIASALYAANDFWNSASVQETVFTRKTGNAIIDTVNMILGTSGLFDILKNPQVHPIALLSGMGKSMVDASIRNLFAGIVGQGIGELLSDNFIGKMAGVAGDFAFKFGMMGLSIGFILYYILPLMPFIYFFFAFSGWIKSIFEAIVAMPLWAIAHLRIDGHGLPGPLATNGYFLLFEIFLRPTLIIAGFILSISIFSALVNVLNEIFRTLVVVATGGDMYSELLGIGIDPATGELAAGVRPTGTFGKNKGPMDEAFYTAIYAIIVYMIGLSSFKLVDTIPNNIMRWMGVTVSTFHEGAGDPAGELSGKMYRSVRMTNVQITSMIKRAKGQGGDRDVTDEMIKQMH